MARYNQPQEGAPDWNVPLNRNFADLGIEVTEEVSSWIDLPGPGDTSKSSNGQWPVYRVVDDRVFVRVTDSSREIVGGLGSSGHPLPETHHRVVYAEVASFGSQSEGTVIDVSAEPYNAPTFQETGDAAPAIQQAYDDLPARGGTLLFPTLYDIETPLDATDGKPVKWAATGPSVNTFSQINSGLVGQAVGGIRWKGGTGGVMIDATGGHMQEFTDGFSLFANTDVPDVGILMARASDPGDATGFTFDGMQVSGAFSVAGVFNTSREVSSMTNCNLIGQDAEIIRHDPQNDAGVTSPYSTIVTSSGTLSNSRWHYEGNRFLQYAVGSPAITIAQSCEGHNFSDNYWTCDDAAAVTVRTGGGTVNAGVSFENPRVERGDNAAHLMSATGGGIISGIRITDGRYSSSDAGGDQPFLDFSGHRVENLDYEGGRRTSFDATSGMVFGELLDSHIRTLAGGGTITLETTDSRNVYHLGINWSRDNSSATTVTENTTY